MAATANASATAPPTEGGIAVVNSLAPGAPVPFVTKEPGVVTWYACGPTVYDLSHMGHARNYVSTDVIRRILLHYFQLRVHFVMNITDVDDKIILKARRKRLFDLERAKPDTAPAARRALVRAAFRAYVQANLPRILEAGSGTLDARDALDADALDETNYAARRDAAYGAVLAGGTLAGEGRPGDAEAKAKMHVANADAAARALQGASEDGAAEDGGLLGAAEEVLLPYLDGLYRETIDTSDHSMFTDLTRGMEALFTADMDALNVLRPDAVTRVTEYVPQIVAFIEGIVRQGFAYEADASVYFDIEAFERAGHTYARLRPESRNDKALQEEGEGSLSKGAAGKRRPGDFALWKKSKPGEPSWPSPWGPGRPGWHIECSVMASDRLGTQMDVHSGGIDLAFPHHDNELAQSEAYFHEAVCGGGAHAGADRGSTWVRYFFHMGHLSIAGSKMSKSLKNFQTIQDALATTYTARSMRIVFLLSRWHDGLEISPDMRKQASSWENTLDNLFANVKARLAEAGVAGGLGALSLEEGSGGGALADELARAQRDLDAALRNSFDTPAALQVLLRLVREANVHMSDARADLGAVAAVARWVTKIVGILGLDPTAAPPYEGRLGWGPPNPAGGAAAGGGAGAAAETKKAAAGPVDPQTAVQPYSAVYARVKGDVAALGLTEEAGLSTLLAELRPDAELAALLAEERATPAAGADPTDAVEQLALPYLRAVSRLRDELRRVAAAATGTQAAATKQAALALSDRIRDYDLVALGVQLDDQTDRPSLIKFVPQAKLVAAREERAAAAAERARAKAAAAAARAQAEAEKWAKAAVAPADLFRDAAQFSAWDADGLPTRLADGSDVPKTQQKRLRKEWERQKKLHEAYLARA